MLPTAYEALAIVLLGLVPGFLATAFWTRAKTWKGRGSDLLTILQSLALSVVIQATVSWFTILWIYPDRQHLEDHPWRVAVWVVIVVLLVPIFGGSLVARLGDWIAAPTSIWTRKSLLRRIWAPYNWLFPPTVAPTIWDAFFADHIPDPSLLVVEFNDGTRVAGMYAVGAEAITSPAPQGLFLIEQWTVDDHGDPIGPIHNSGGVMITTTANIRAVRVIQGEQHG
jgi:predicted Na+-dependent transporter